MSLLRMRDVVRDFDGMPGVHGIDLDLRAGEVMGLAGGSGAGKSVLIDLVAGELAPDSGQVVFAGNPTVIPRYAGVVKVVRHPSAVALDLSVAENVFAGAEPRNRFGLVDRRQMAKRTTEALRLLGLRIDPWARVRQLSPAMRCAVQIAAAVVSGARVVAVDGLSSILSERQVRQLLPVISKVAGAGVGVLYASRCVRELYAVCDRITVLCEGRGVGTFAVGEADPGQLVTRMLRTDTSMAFARRTANKDAEPVFSVSGLRSGDDVVDVSFSVGSGEVVALVGSGSTQTGRALFGAAPVVAGEILVHGKPLRLRSPRDAVRAGIGYLSGNQELSGLFGCRTVGTSLAAFARSLGWFRRRTQRHLVRNTRTLLGVHCPQAEAPVDRISVGDQRKLGLAKWLAAESDVLILDDPGNHVDSFAKAEIRWMIRELAAAGVAVLVISNDIVDVLDLADRVVVLRAGRTVSSLVAADATEQDVVSLAIGSDIRRPAVKGLG